MYRQTDEISSSTQQNLALRSMQSFSSQRLRCYLCETPKRDYALVRSFSEIVCRSCLNFEGCDRLEEALAEARRIKQVRRSGRHEQSPDWARTKPLPAKQGLDLHPTPEPNASPQKHVDDVMSGDECNRAQHHHKQQTQPFAQVSVQPNSPADTNPSALRAVSTTSDSPSSLPVQSEPLLRGHTDATSAAINIPQILPYLLGNGHLFYNTRPTDQQLAVQNYNADCMIDSNTYGRFLQMSAAAASAAINPTTFSPLNSLPLDPLHSQLTHAQVETVHAPVAQSEVVDCCNGLQLLSRHESHRATQTTEPTLATRSMCYNGRDDANQMHIGSSSHAVPRSASSGSRHSSAKPARSLVRSVAEESMRLQQSSLRSAASLGATTQVASAAHRVSQKAGAEKGTKSKDAGAAIRSKLRAKLLDSNHKPNVRDNNPYGSTNAAYTGNCGGSDPVKVRKGSSDLCSRSSSVSSVESEDARVFGLLKRVSTMSHEKAADGAMPQIAARQSSMQTVSKTSPQLTVKASNSLLDSKQPTSATLQQVKQQQQQQQHPQQQAQDTNLRSPIVCLTCNMKLEDRHFVQCPTVVAHKFCFACSKKSIEAQRAECRRLSLVERISCPSGKRCLHMKEQSPWTFMNSEIDTITRESNSNGVAILAPATSGATSQTTGALGLVSGGIATTTATLTTTAAMSEAQHKQATRSAPQCASGNKPIQSTDSQWSPMIDRGARPQVAGEQVAQEAPNSSCAATNQTPPTRYRKPVYFPPTNNDKAAVSAHGQEPNCDSLSSRLEFRHCSPPHQQVPEINKNRTSPVAAAPSPASSMSVSPRPVHLSAATTDDSSDNGSSGGLPALKRLAADAFAGREHELGNDKQINV